MPPRIIPRTDPVPHTMLFRPNAFPLSLGGNTSDIRANEFEVKSAAPIPCIALNITNINPVVDNPESADPIINTIKPTL